MMQPKHNEILGIAAMLAIVSLCLFITETHQLDGPLSPPPPPPPEGPTTGEGASQTGRSKRPEQVTIIAPKFLRPMSEFHVLINLANSQAPATIDLQLIGARDSNREQTEAKSVLASPNETQTVKFRVGDWPPAEYVLSVNVQAVDRSWEFKGEKAIAYQAKSVSIFIQTDKAIYKPGQLVQFRALFLNAALRPLVLKNSINVTVEDPKHNVVKQWQWLSNYRGLLSLEMPLSEDPMLGEYTIKVATTQAGGANSQPQEASKQFEVAEYVLPTFDVQIQLPTYATYNESDIVVSVRSSYTYGRPVRGHVTLTVQPLVRFHLIKTRPLHQAQYRARLQEDGSADFPLDVVKDLKLEERADLFEREIEFFALVEEDLTSRKYNKSQTMRVHASNIKIERLDKEGDSFKPGLPKWLRYKVAYQDDVPVEDNGPQVELKYTVSGRQVQRISLRPRGGFIEHELNVPAQVSLPQLEELKATPNIVDIEVNYRQSRHYLDPIPALQSESHQYLQVSLPQLQAQRIRRDVAAPGSVHSISVGDQLKVQVRATEPMQQVTCQGLSRGDIVWALHKQLADGDQSNKTEFEFDIQVDQRMAPQSRVLCFYVRGDESKELIADSVEVNVVNGLVRNLIKLVPSRDEAKPGQEVEVGVFTKPNSLVGILGIDQSALLLKSGNDLSSKEITEDLKSYGSSSSSSSSSKSKDPADDGWWGPASEGQNTASLLAKSDVVVLTNNYIYDGLGSRLGRPLNSPNAYQLMASRGWAGSRIALDSLVLDHPIQPPEVHLQSTQPKADPVKIRTLFPETWLWQNGTSDASGQIKFSAPVPDTITSWQLSAFSLNEAFGLALSSGKTSVRVFRPFFIKLNLPYAIIRGETVSIQAIVFNYSKRKMAARVSLDNKKQEFEFVEAANSIQDEKHSNGTSESRLVQIAPNGAASASFLIKPSKLGHIDIKVLAQGDYVGDGLVKKLLVKPEGQTQHFNKAVLVQLPGTDAASAGGRWRRNVTIEVPANAVPGSQRVQVAAIGDILGAGLSNIDDLLRLPYGCGEQNMVNLVPNIVILNYLKNTGRLREVQRERATRNIQVGYQRQLNYKRQDGSFSAFGESDPEGSVWLTAYVLKTLQQAKLIISVDKRVVSGAAEFIRRHSRPQDGAIQEVGMLHNRALASASASASNASDQNSARGPKSIYLTAYSLIALMQSASQDQRDSKQQEVVERGLDFLEQQLAQGEQQLSAYDLAIISYTLELASGKRQESANRAYDALWARAIEQPDENQVHWSSSRDSPSPADSARPSSEIDLTSESEGPSPSLAPSGGEREELSLGEASTPANQNQLRQPKVAAKLTDQVIPPLKPFAVKKDQSAHLFAPNSFDVELASWALLTATRRNELERALPIVRWLVSKQNSLGGFASTQDTVLAIEALSSYAEATTNGAAVGSGSRPPPQSIEVEFVYPRASSNGQQLRRTNLDQMVITRANSLVQQQTRLPDNITWVQVQATGAGVAVVQVAWQYNLLVSGERPAFFLNPILDRSSSANYLQLSVCTFYKGEGGASNMAVAEVELPSGYVADSEALPSLRRHAQIKRIDTSEADTKVLVYLESVTRDELCFTVPAHRSTKVSNNRPVPVTIYDYYKRDQAARIFYKPPQASSCDICESQSCGDSCAATITSSQPTSRLVSLHEQRQLAAAKLKAKHQQQDQNPNPNPETETGHTHSELRDGQLAASSNSSSFDAFKLLPLSSAFAALDEAAQNTSGLHF